MWESLNGSDNRISSFDADFGNIEVVEVVGKKSGSELSQSQHHDRDGDRDGDDASNLANTDQYEMPAAFGGNKRGWDSRSGGQSGGDRGFKKSS
jgi:hypothetical protein